MRNDPVRAVPKPVKDVTRTRARNNGKYAETKVAKALGGRKVMFSGAGALEKGDVRVDDIRPPAFVEVKYSGDIKAKDGAHSVSFQYEWAEKTILDAQAAGCVPVIALRFANLPNTLYVVTDAYLEDLISQSRRLHALEEELEQTPVPPQPHP